MSSSIPGSVANGQNWMGGLIDRLEVFEAKFFECEYIDAV